VITGGSGTTQVEEHPMQRSRDDGGESWADDDELAGEIELYGDLVVAASSQEEPMTSGEIDSVLGLDEDAPDRVSS
jgi:hypothetical protein